MNRLSDLLENRNFHILLLLTIIPYVVLRYLPLPFTNSDPAIYMLVGEAIYREGILPYDLMFDHKPFLIYFIYGLAALVRGSLNVLVPFTLIWLLILSLIVHRVLLKRSVPLLLTFFVMAAATHGNITFSGNSEIVYMPLELLAVGLALGSEERPFRLVLSAAAAVAATSVNYVSGLPLLPALLFCLYVTSGSFTGFLIRSIQYFFVSIFIFAAVFGLLALAGMDLGNYFELQYRFLTSYSKEEKELSIRFIFIQVATLLPIGAILLVPGLNLQRRFHKLNTAILILIIFSMIAFFLNGKFFPQYAFMVTAPLAVFVLTLDYSRTWLRAAFSLTLIGLGFINLAFGLPLGFERWNMPDPNKAYARLAEAVGDEPVMSLHASVVPLYFTRIRPFQPLVFSDHAEIIYGADADGYYLEHLKKQPRFVMVSGNWCTQEAAAWESCKTLLADYEEILSQEPDWPVHDYRLYSLKPS